MTVIMPADYYAAKKLVKAAAEYVGPVYLRFTRDPVPFIYDESQEFIIGKAVTIKEGTDIALIANGDIMSVALSTAEALETCGYSVRLLDMHTIKPIDEEAVLDCLHTIGKIITIEDHNIINGLGSAVCEIAAENSNGIEKRVGVQGQFGESAPYDFLLEKNGITKDTIVTIAKQLLLSR